MPKILRNIRRARKAITAAAIQVGTVIVMFAPDDAHAVKVGIGLLGSLFALLAVYRVPNSKQ